MDEVISDTIRTLPCVPWVDLCSGDGRVTSALWLAHGNPTYPPILVDVADKTSKAVKEIVHPKIITKDVKHLAANMFGVDCSSGIVTIIQPPDLEILNASLSFAASVTPKAILIYSSHNIEGIINRIKRPSEYSLWPSSPSSRVYMRKSPSY